MSDINLDLYKVFCTVVESKNYKEASEKLFITEQTISSRISSLEEKLKTTLFYREKEGLILTENGKKLYDSMSEKIKEMEFSEKAFIQNYDISKMKISIGVPSHISVFYLTNFIAHARKDYPKLKIDIIGATDYSGLIDLLQKHIVDFVIIDTIPSIAKGEMKVKALKKVENIFISNKPLKITELQELEHYNFITNYETSVSIKNLTTLLEKSNIALNTIIHSDVTEMRIEAVKQGLGIGYVIKDAVEKEIKSGELYEVKVPIDLPVMEINLIYKEKYLTEISKMFIKKYLTKD